MPLQIIKRPQFKIKATFGVKVRRRGVFIEFDAHRLSVSGIEFGRRKAFRFVGFYLCCLFEFDHLQDTITILNLARAINVSCNNNRAGLIL